MRLSIVEGCATQIFLNFTAGSLLTGYTLHLGGGPVELAAVASVPLVGQMASPLAAWAQALFPRRRLLVTWLAAAGRFIWLLPALFPLLSMPRESAAWYLVLVVAVSSVFQASAGAVWAAWMGELVPDRRRGRYFGLRNGILSTTGMGANLLGGVLLDALPEPLNYQAMIVLALVCAAAGIRLYSKHYEPPLARDSLGIRDVFATPMRDRNFRRFLWFAMYWQAAVLAGSPFVYPYLLDHMGMSFTQIALWSSLAAATTLVTSPLWGRLADRVGNKPVLVVSTVIAGSLLPLSWILATPGNLTMIWISAVLDAIAWGAINPAIFNLALASAPKRNRVSYIAIFSFATGLAGFAAGMAGGMLVRATGGLQFAVAGYEWTPYHTIFLVSGLVRCGGWIFLRGVRETHAWSMGDAMRAFRRWTGGSFFWR